MRKGVVILLASLMLSIPVFGFDGEVGVGLEKSWNRHHFSQHHFRPHHPHFFHGNHHFIQRKHHYSYHPLRIYVVPRIPEYDVGDYRWNGDLDRDGVINRFDADDDGDGTPDNWDFFPLDPDH